MTFDLLKDLTPVAPLTTAKLWLIGRGDLPPNNLKELIAWLKANPDKATAGTIGAGSGTQLCLIYLQQNTGTKFQLVPYRGTAPIFTDLLAGHVDLTCPEAGQTLALLPQRQDQGLCRDGQNALVCGARCADHRRGRRAGPAHDVLVRLVGAGRNAAGHHRQAQRRGGRHASTIRRCGTGSPKRAMSSRRASN